MDRVSILFIIAPLLLPCCAERLNFHQSTNASWDEARRHCQVCFKDLVTVSYDNSLALVQEAKGRHWIGLRENYKENLGGEPWSAWANEDPITFQNWYRVKPQAPVVETTTALPQTTTACPQTTTGGFTDTSSGFTDTSSGFTDTSSGFTDTSSGLTDTSSGLTDTSSGLTDTSSGLTDTSSGLTDTSSGFTHSSSGFTETASVAFTDTAVPTTKSYDDTTSLTTTQYVREDCVAMHNFGPWVEEDCATKLPYICYDERFYGIASVERNATTARLTWEEGPGNISSYRVEVQGDVPLNDSVEGLTYDIFNMTPGSKYEVRVYAVKCDRELNSQNVSFITKPEMPINLTVVNTTELSAFLRWDRPMGYLSFYCVRVRGKPCSNTTEVEAVIPGLIPGGRYTVEVLSVTGDVHSEFADITVLTRPSMVEDLNISSITDHSLVLSWSPGDGNATGYRVVAVEQKNTTIVWHNTVDHPVRQVTVSGVPSGTHLQLTVWAQAHGNLEGDEASTESFIAPAPVPSLLLTPNATSIEASWPAPSGSYESFHVSVQLTHSSDPTDRITTTTSLTLDKLFAAAEYQVTVSTRAGNLVSKPTVNSTHTQPVMAEGLNISHRNSTHATLEWRAPNAAPNALYLVKYSGSFWDHHGEPPVTRGQTSVTVGGLRPGTRYKFQVITVSGLQESDPASLSHFTSGINSEVTLSMICSSARHDCENEATRKDVLKELTARMGKVLDGVFWELKWKEQPQLQ